MQFFHDVVQPPLRCALTRALTAQRSKGRPQAGHPGEAIRQGLRLACKLASLPQKTATQTAKNGGQLAIRLFNRVNVLMASEPPFPAVSELGLA